MDATPAHVPAPTPSSTIGLPVPPEGAQVLLLEQAAERLGVHICALRIWVNGRGMPYDLCARDRERMVRPMRFRAPGPFVRNPKICFLASEIDALKAQIDASYEPFPHPDTANFPGCHLVPIPSKGERKGPRYALIDSVDAPLVSGLRLNLWRRFDSDRSVVGLAANPSILLKQIILGLRTIDRSVPLRDQPDTKVGVDARIVHRNGDDLDCRKANLEVRDPEQASAGNSKMRSRNGEPLTSGYKGVCWEPERECWCVYICKGKSYYLGGFDDEADAAREYDNAARWLFGEQYAKLNFPLERPALRRPSRGALSRPGAIERVAADGMAEGKTGLAA